MKRFLSIILAVLVCISSFAMLSTTVFADDGNSLKQISLSTNSTGARYFVDADGNPVNLFGIARSQHHPEENEAGFKSLSNFVLYYKSMGLNYIRLAIDISDIVGAVIDDSLSLTTSEQIAEYIENNIAPDIETIINAGMYVGLDMHMYVPGGETVSAAQTINYAKNNFLPIMVELAKKYKDEPMVAVYELWNEPYPANITDINYDRDEWNGLVRDYYIEAVNEIRKYDTVHTLLVSDWNAGWGTANQETWNGYYDKIDPIYRNTCFSVHAGINELDKSYDFYENKWVEIANGANICLFFGEVETEDVHSSNNTIANLTDFLDNTEADCHFAAALWRSHGKGSAYEEIWGTSEWASEYTGCAYTYGELIETNFYTNFFAADGVTSEEVEHQHWATQFYTGDKMETVDGTWQVAIYPDYAKIFNAFYRHKFTKAWGSGRVDLTGCNYLVMKIQLEDENAINGGQTGTLLTMGDVTASQADFINALKENRGQLSAGKWATLYIPLSGTLSGEYSDVIFDFGYEWSANIALHIAEVGFADSDYVKEALASAPYEKVIMSEDLTCQGDWDVKVSMSNSVDFYRHNGGRVTYSEAEKALAFYWVNVDMDISLADWISGSLADFDKTEYIVFRIKVDNAAYAEQIIDTQLTGILSSVDGGNVTISREDFHNALVEQSDDFIAGNWCDIAVPFNGVSSNEIRTMKLDFALPANEAAFYIQGIKLVNKAYLDEDSGNQEEEAPTEPYEKVIMSEDLTNQGDWGVKVSMSNSVDFYRNNGGSVSYNEDEKALSLYWLNVDMDITLADWVSGSLADFNKTEYIVFRIKVTDREFAEQIIGKPLTGILSSVDGGNVTISREDFHNALVKQSDDFIAGNWCDIAVPLNGVSSNEVRTMKLDFALPEKGEAFYIQGIKLVNKAYLDKDSGNQEEDGPIKTCFFAADGVTSEEVENQHWSTQFNTGDKMEVVDGAWQVAIYPDYAKIFNAFYHHKFTKAWGSGSVDLSGCNYLIMKIRLEDASAIYGGQTGTLLKMGDVTASQADFINALKENSEQLSAGEWATLYIPLSGELSGKYSSVIFDFGYEWSANIAMHIAEVSFANKEYVETAKSVYKGLFAADGVSDESGNYWLLQSSGDGKIVANGTNIALHPEGLEILNAYYDHTFSKKDGSAVDLTGCDTLMLKVKLPDAGAINVGQAGTLLTMGDVTASQADFVKALREQSDLLTAGEWATLYIPLSGTLDGKYSEVTINFGYEWSATVGMYISNIAFVSKNYTESKDMCYVEAKEATFTKAGTNACWYDSKTMKRYTSIEANEPMAMNMVIMYAKCDIDRNGYADAADMIMLRKGLLNGTTIENADLNSDKNVNILDLILMKKHLTIGD